MDLRLRELALRTKGFMPEAQGLALYRAARVAALYGPILEVGSYCGKSAIYLGAAAREARSLLFSLDHHRGSEEHQPGQEFHDPALVDGEGRVDTLPCFRRTIALAGLERHVIAIVGSSVKVCPVWRTPLSLVFLDGGHSKAQAIFDLGWADHLKPDGILAIHDVFPDPAQGGRPPYEAYQQAQAMGFQEIAAEGSLRLLRR
jgi:predicted O-methyltransferase YrrM